MIRADDGAGSLGRVKNLAAVAEKPRLVNTSHARGAHSPAEALRNPVGNRDVANYFMPLDRIGFSFKIDQRDCENVKTRFWLFSFIS